ncbi:tetratricopeptide repeat protein [Aquiflexum sp. LQ15W]|uniref:tetratricopeptide repeat-containing sensor histidine kinase n=1 Tax=Cognataquiflexum nitidum TaxID=2922272 RepID=UPI001F148733|nr:tetratricopeptide repeat protein [Cognataquiflexum nitidum]MCH6201636.1 tetratricopeptide repeat protein [Cognataquiflexum nitidum]
MIFTVVNRGLSQSELADSLLEATSKLNDDSTKVSHYLELGLEYLDSDIKKAIYYFDEAILIGSKIDFKKGLANAYNAKGRASAKQGNFQDAILNFQESLKHFHDINDKTGEANILSNLGSIYYMLGNSTKALELHFQSLKLSEELNNKLRIGTSLNNIGTVYLKNRDTINESLTFFKKSLEVFQGIQEKQGMATAAMNIGEVYFLDLKYDSAIYFHEMALGLCDGTLDATFPLTQLGEINAELGNFQKAFGFHRRALEISERLDAKFELTQGLLGLAKTQGKKGDFENAINTLEKAKLLAHEIEAKNELVDVYLNLAEINAFTGDFKAAYENELNAKSVKEEIARSSTEKMIQQLQFEFELDKKEAEIILLQKDTELKNAAVFNQRIIIFTSLGGLLMFIIISISLFKNNLSKQKANHLLQVQKEEIHAQREKVESAYDQLKSAQAQLIQSEKMASLGELTAGVAHEIQNPLNFVNNFSEVSSELIDEIEQERAKDRENRDEALVSEILIDLKSNIDKITHHGKRADAIVKGMLAHSRTSSGEKELTDINALCDEYLRMSYHGIMAKDKTFNGEIVTVLDPNLPKVNVIPQNIGRVLFNMINNAFQACAERKAQLSQNSNPDGYPEESFQPLVTVSTSPLESLSRDIGRSRGIEISIKDNGPGIPDSIKDKIFQPFFTTKPTGQGTGLGLSLSYDIVKAHGGEINVVSKCVDDLIEGQSGTTFLITLPLT